MLKKVFQHFWKKENQIGRINKILSDELIKKTLESAKTIAMIGVSSVKKEVSTNIKRRPSTIVMKYMQEFGYKVIPVNPFSVGEKVHGETIVGKLNDIKISNLYDPISNYLKKFKKKKKSINRYFLILNLRN